MSRKKATPPPPPPPPTWDEVLINALLPFRMQVAGVILLILSLVTFLALPGWTQSGWLLTWASWLRNFLGWGAYMVCISGAAIGIHWLLHNVPKPYQITPTQVIGFELIALTLLPVTHQLSDIPLPDLLKGQGSGLVGWALAEPMLAFFGPILTNLFYLALIAWGVALLFTFDWDDLLKWLNTLSDRLGQWSQQLAAPLEAGAKESQTAVLTTPSRPPRQDQLIIIDNAADDDAPKLRRRHPDLPDIALLEEAREGSIPPAEIDAKKAKIEQTLLDFGLPATVTEIRRGPAVTQFGVLPGYIQRPGSDGQTREQKVRVGQIASLQKDLALALAVPRLRVEAPVPGRGVVGIEVPNSETAVVRLKTIIGSDTFYKLNKPMSVALGRDVSGAPMAIDLAKLPHLLIAGTTGSGKSVCMNALITCLVFNNTPEQLQLVMIDPKKVELIRFNDLPHLIGTVEVEADRAVGVLRWLTAEMDRRYEMFAQVGARNLNGYNRKIAKKKNVKKLPYMAVFIDELADLMHTYPGDVERTLCRLAQMARATGIHLVVATQRPSTDVITGLIKANFPARLSFAVTSGIDSRVILDSTGAENLLGKGDMLFLSPEEGAPARVQGVFVSDKEIESIVNHWQATLPQDYQKAPSPWEDLLARHALINQTDSLLEDAIALVKKHDNISTSLLQRRLRLGYPRAARLMQHLYDMGLVEDPKTGGKTRRTFVSGDDIDPLGDFLSQQE